MKEAKDVSTVAEAIEYLFKQLGEHKQSYSQGKLNEHDEGDVKFAVGGVEGKVICVYPKPVTWHAMPVNTAIDMGLALITSAIGQAAPAHRSTVYIRVAMNLLNRATLSAANDDQDEEEEV